MESQNHFPDEPKYLLGVYQARLDMIRDILSGVDNDYIGSSTVTVLKSIVQLPIVKPK